MNTYITKKDIIDKLNFYEIDHKKIISKYESKTRYYHNLDHILFMLNKAYEKDVLTDNLFLAIVFHDVIYSTNIFLNKFNELLSGLYFKFCIKNKLPKNDIDRIYKAILSTKNHKIVNTLSHRLIELDLYVLYNDFDTFKEFEDNIRKEYKHIKTKHYYYNRYIILKKYNISKEKLYYVLKKYRIELTNGNKIF